ncbi:MAG: hypothetical protein KGD63_12325 [Candidatus Lokiarchaeota archaeon]|nr:hypothetical protein [Candidatus Lokiarchaeota archaeon]
MNIHHSNHFNRYRCSFSWNIHENNILNIIEKNKVIKRIRDSVIEKQLEKRKKS